MWLVTFNLFWYSTWSFYIWCARRKFSINPAGKFWLDSRYWWMITINKVTFGVHHIMWLTSVIHFMLRLHWQYHYMSFIFPLISIICHQFDIDWSVIQYLENKRNRKFLIKNKLIETIIKRKFIWTRKYSIFSYFF